MEMMEYSLEDKGQTKNQRLIETSIDENKRFFFFFKLVDQVIEL